MKVAQNLYVSEWGEFPIPDDLYARTPMVPVTSVSWEEGEPDYVSLQPAKKATEFWAWLDQQERKAGKP
jgi:hypothetical protein